MELRIMVTSHRTATPEEILEHYIPPHLVNKTYIEYSDIGRWKDLYIELDTIDELKEIHDYIVKQIDVFHGVIVRQDYRGNYVLELYDEYRE